jgi:hypothetical protein
MIDPIEIENVERRLSFNENDEIEIINKSKLQQEAVESEFKKLNADLEHVKYKAKVLKTDIEHLQKLFLHAVKMLRGTASKSDLTVIEKKVDAWSPDRLVTRKELRKLISERINQL